MDLDPSRTHLLARLDIIARRVAAFVAGRRDAGQSTDDPFRGLYLADADVQRLLGPRQGMPVVDDDDARTEIERRAQTAEAAGHDIRLRRLTRSFDLSKEAVDILLIALAPDLDRRFEGLYGFLHDDVTRRRATPWLALELTGCSTLDPATRSQLMDHGPLVRGGLILTEELDRPFLTRSLRVPDRVSRHLLGDDEPATELVSLLVHAAPHVVGDSAALAHALRDHTQVAYLHETAGGGASGLARAAFAQLGPDPLILDLERLASSELAGRALRSAVVEARLTGRGLVVGPVDDLAERSPVDFGELVATEHPLVVYGRRSWDPAWCTRMPLLVDVPDASPNARLDLWRTTLDGKCAPDVDPAAATASFRLAPEAVWQAAASAVLQASYAGRAVTGDDLQTGARAQNAGGLERLAHRVRPQIGLDAVVLPAEPLELVQELVARARRRGVVLDGWQLRQTGRRGDGISGLFVGPPGTGKSLAAEAVAGELGLDLYTVELATVVDKYIGETEKNLDRIFSQAERVNGVLFFDEADALFGKRSEVKDARDRYANVEVAYLLQRMEAFDGLAILATNLRVNLDEAFTRRLDLLVEFPVPDEADRLRLWRRCFGPAVPLDDDVDLDFCANAFEMSGGDIRNVTLTAAYLAADAERAVAMADVVRAIQREYRKAGRLCVESEFGAYWPIIAPAG